MTKGGAWVYPFQGRNVSMGTAQNFLWRLDTTFIMDNHRAAAWCWVQDGFAEQPHSVLHIDAHFDTAGAGERSLTQLGGTFSGLSFDEYHSIFITDAGHEIPVFRWDNYLSLYERLYGDRVTRWVFATHGIGTAPTFDIETVPLEELLAYLQSTSTKGERWIINLDLDVFHSQDGDRFPAALRTGVFEALVQMATAAESAVVTVALSPECCGSWQDAEALCQEFCEIWGLPFELPN